VAYLPEDEGARPLRSDDVEAMRAEQHPCQEKPHDGREPRFPRQWWDDDDHDEADREFREQRQGLRDSAE
jgi:hypothetical protein